MKEKRLQALFKESLDRGIGSGIAASFGSIESLIQKGSGNTLFLGTHGHDQGMLPVTESSFFDLASLTKILATTLLSMVKVERGELALDEPLGIELPVTLAQLLTHTSGLPAWRPFYEQMRSRFGERLRSVSVEERKQAFDEFLDRVPLENAVGERVVYSDLGFLHLERALSSEFGTATQELYSKIPDLQLHFRAVEGDQKPGLEQYVMTERCPWRGPLQGEVHDDNAWSRGGISGHAGLFGRLKDLETWVASFLSEKWVSMKTVREFSRTIVDTHGAKRALGFDVPPSDGSGSTGSFFSQNTIGHLGFTGTSLWMDLDSGDYAILLTNRVHPSRSDDRIRALRREFHEIIRS